MCLAAVSLRNKRVKILSDNKNVSSVLQIGSQRSDLQSRLWICTRFARKGALLYVQNGYQETVAQQQIV